MTYPDGFYVSYSYYADDTGWFIRDNTGAYILRHEYDDYGRMLRKKLGNVSPYALTAAYGYDAQLRLSSLGNDLGTGGATAYDNTDTFTYNAADQIVLSNASNSSYWMKLPSNASTYYAIDGLNRIASVGASGFSYDNRGNMTSDGGSDTYAYNADNLMTSAIQSGVTTSLTYDAENRLPSIAKNGTTTKFLYDGTDMIAEYNGSGTLLRRDVHGPGMTSRWYGTKGRARPPNITITPTIMARSI